MSATGSGRSTPARAHYTLSDTMTSVTDRSVCGTDVDGYLIALPGGGDVAPTLQEIVQQTIEARRDKDDLHSVVGLGSLVEALLPGLEHGRHHHRHAVQGVRPRLPLLPGAGPGPGGPGPGRDRGKGGAAPGGDPGGGPGQEADTARRRDQDRRRAQHAHALRLRGRRGHDLDRDSGRWAPGRQLRTRACLVS